MNDDEYAALMLRPLAGEPAGPPGIDVPKAMRDGRRLRSRRWWTGSLGTLLATGLITGGVLLAPGRHETPLPDLPPDPAVPAACTAGRLPAAGHRSAEVKAGDSTGRWLIGTSDALSKKPGVLVWHDGKVVADRPVQADVWDINASGVGVGSRRINGKDYPYVIRDGRLIRLPGGIGDAAAINDAGVIVGTIGQNDQARPARWRTPDSPPELLPAALGIPGTATMIDIAPDGTAAVAASSLRPGIPTTGENGRPNPDAWRHFTALWTPDGKVRALEAPGDTDFHAVGFAYGWLYGGGFPPVPGQGPLLRYHPDTGTWQQVAPAHRKAQVTGPSRWGKFIADVPAIYVGTGVLELPKEMDAVRRGSGDFLVETASDNAHVVAGTGVGVNSDPTKPFQPIIWTCHD